MTRIVVIMGPTASGKSALALKWAQQRGGEIVSIDSMQVYRGLEIGTAQPTAEERKLVPHHLVGIMDIRERVEVFSFCARADAAIADIAARIEGEDVTVSKIAYRINAASKAGKLEKGELTLVGEGNKKRKVVAYKLA